jgi:hypothetical protein
MKVEREIKEICYFPDVDSSGIVGAVDVSFHLLNESDGNESGTFDIRVFFTDATMTFQQITTEAYDAALIALSNLLKLSEVSANAEELLSRWK